MGPALAGGGGGLGMFFVGFFCRSAWATATW